MKIGIIGAGISGLALGASLHRSGLDVHIYEKYSQVRGGGAGITLAPNGLAALDALGVGAGFRALQVGQRSLRGGVRNPRGEWLSHISAEITSTSLALERAELHALLLDQIPAEIIHTSAAALTVDAQSGVVGFKDGAEVQFDIVVGADGIHSAVRRNCFDDPGVRYAGYNAWRALADAPSLDAGFETWGTRARFGAVPLHNGRAYWFAVLSGPEASPNEADLSELMDVFSLWHHPIPALLDSTPEASIQYLPIQEIATPLSTYHTGKVVLIGDAAHAMTPNLGQGACQGLEDAAVLAALLQLGSMDFTLYDNHRRHRSQKIARQSRLVGRSVHTGGARLASVRNWILKHIPDAVTNAQAHTVTNWTMPTL